MRFTALALLLHFLALNTVPAVLVVDFLAERGRIERERCVQRMVPEGRRTCHGECALKKRLADSSDKERRLPMELRALKFGEMIADGGRLLPLFSPRGLEHARPEVAAATCGDRADPPAPVPWC